jgi:hypothetical protein
VIGHRVALRPRSMLETGDLTFALIQRHPKPFVRLLPWVLVPALVCWGVHALTEWNPYELLLLQFLITGVTAGPYTILCGDLMLTGDVSAKEVQQRFLKAAPRYVLLSLATLFVPVLFFLPYGLIAFFPEAILLERGTLGAAFTRSRTLLRSTPGRGAAMVLVIGALALFGGSGMELARYSFRALFGLSLAPLDDLWSHLSWAPFVGLALVRPYLAAFRFLLYIDCRTRREGWDLQVQFSALAARSASRTSLSREAA